MKFRVKSLMFLYLTTKVDKYFSYQCWKSLQCFLSKQILSRWYAKNQKRVLLDQTFLSVPDKYIKFLWHPFLLEIPQWLDKLELPTEKWISRRQLKTAITFAKIKYSCCVLSIKQRYLPVELFVINSKYR